jgi:hypothetical protein
MNADVQKYQKMVEMNLCFYLDYSEYLLEKELMMMGKD